MKIQIIIFDGVDEIDFVGPYEIFRHAAMLGKKIETTLVTLDPKKEIQAQHGLRVRPDAILDGPVDLVVVPGGGWVSNAPFGIRQEIKRGVIQKRIASLHEQGVAFAGVCTGGIALGAAGLLKGRAATTHKGAREDLQKLGAEIIDARVVDGGNILTCGGVTSCLEMGLWIIQRFFDLETANAIADYMEHARVGKVHVC